MLRLLVGWLVDVCVRLLVPHASDLRSSRAGLVIRTLFTLFVPPFALFIPFLALFIPFLASFVPRRRRIADGCAAAELLYARPDQRGGAVQRRAAQVPGALPVAQVSTLAH